jgi:purine-binding chemotaxis protein CheW
LKLVLFANIINTSSERRLNMANYVVFSVNEQEMAVPTENVERIMNLANVVKIPGSLDFIEGALNYNNQIIPVINLEKLLRIDCSNSLSRGSQIIVIQSNQNKAAILVDEVKNIETSDEN